MLSTPSSSFWLTFLFFAYNFTFFPFINIFYSSSLFFYPLPLFFHQPLHFRFFSPIFSLFRPRLTTFASFQPFFVSSAVFSPSFCHFSAFPPFFHFYLCHSPRLIFYVSRPSKCFTWNIVFHDFRSSVVSERRFAFSLSENHPRFWSFWFLK